MGGVAKPKDMKNNQIYFILLLTTSLLILPMTIVQSQDTDKIDSLKSVLDNPIADTTKIEVLSQLSYEFYPNQLDSTLHYAKLLQKTSDKIDSKMGKALAMNLIGKFHYASQDNESALESYKSGISLLEEIGKPSETLINIQINLIICLVKMERFDEAIQVGLPILEYPDSDQFNVEHRERLHKYMGNAYLGIEDSEKAMYHYKMSSDVQSDPEKKAQVQNDNARMLYMRGEYSKSLELLLPLVKFNEENGIDGMQSYRTFTLLGGVYTKMEDYESTIEYFKKSLQYLWSSENYVWLVLLTYKIGYIQMNHNKYIEAKQTLSEALKIALKYKVEKDRSTILSGLGYSYYYLKNYDSALYYFNKNLKWATQENDDYNIAQAYSSLGESYFELHDLDKAKAMFDKAKDMFMVMNTEKLDSVNVMRNYLSLYVIDTTQHIYTRSTFENHKKYYALKEAIDRKDLISKMKELELSYETEKKDHKIDLLTAENNLQKANASKLRNLRTSLIIVGLLLILLLGVLLNRYRIKKKAMGIILSQKESLEQKNNENELLIQEIHHRVKNNLQIIQSLLNAQKYRSKGSQMAMDMIIESQNKIKSMALIHESLYNSNNFSKILATTYFEALIVHISDSYKNDKKPIKIDSIIKEESIKMNIAVPLGLIVNELITNAYKYAFDEDDIEKKISVKFGLDKVIGFYELEIRDNGKGIPHEFDFDSTKSFGLQMVNGLVGQLNGKISLDRSEGTKFTIHISDDGMTQRSNVA